MIDPRDLVLTTDRLVLRPLQHDDVDLAIELFTDPQVMAFVGDPATPADLRDEMDTVVRRGAGGCIGIWVILDGRTDEKLGSIFLLPIAIEEEDTDWSDVVPDRLPTAPVEVGYFLRPAVWGQGVATEALTSLLEFAFNRTPIERVVAVTHMDHALSQRVLRKGGLRAIGSGRAYGETMAWFEITRDDVKRPMGAGQ